MLEISDFEKKYADQLILRIPALAIKPGIHWFRGDNGSGKSTLFKSIAGLIPFSGKIKLNGLETATAPVLYRKKVTYSEAEPVCPGFATPRDIIRFVGKARNTPIIKQDQMCEIFGISNYFSSPTGTFSSGMLKKVSLVVAFLGTPDLIILDEPLITLDADSRKILLDVISSQQKSGTSFLLSSHQEFNESTLHIDRTFLVANRGVSEV